MDNHTLRTYAAVWLPMVRPTLRPNSYRSYERALRVSVFPVMGDWPLDQVTRPRLKVWFSGLLGKYTPKSAGQALGVLRVMLASAVEDELLPTNPAGALRRAMRVMRADHEVEALTAEELRAFLEAAKADDGRTCPDSYLGLLLLAMTGLRIGEAVGLQWQDVDLESKVLQVRRQMYENGTFWPLKSKSGRRTIDIADVLAEELARKRRERAAARQRDGVEEGSSLVLCPDAIRGQIVRKALYRSMRRALKAAGLPPTRISCHGLRHTFASLMLQRGEPLQYVQRTLGHASIGMTADVYGRWLPIRSQHGGPSGLYGTRRAEAPAEA